MKPEKVDGLSRIVVALSGSAADDSLLRYTRMLSRAIEGAQFHFVHVLAAPSPSRLGPMVTHAAASQDMRAAVLKHFDGDDRFHTHILTGVRVDSLLEFTAESGCDLIIVGHRRGASGRRSLARRLAMKAPCTVWMVPEESPPKIGGVLAAVDFSEPSAFALKMATLIARISRLEECIVLHAYFIDSRFPGDDHRSNPNWDAVDRFAAPIDLNGVRLRPLFEESASVSHAVQRVADKERVDLVVVGTRGLTQSSAILLGSQSEQVLMDSRIPVVVVKRHGERVGLLRMLLDRDFQPSSFG